MFFTWKITYFYLKNNNINILYYFKYLHVILNKGLFFQEKSEGIFIQIKLKG